MIPIHQNTHLKHQNKELYEVFCLFVYFLITEGILESLTCAKEVQTPSSSQQVLLSMLSSGEKWATICVHSLYY